MASLTSSVTEILLNALPGTRGEYDFDFCSSQAMHISSLAAPTLVKLPSSPVKTHYIFHSPLVGPVLQVKMGKMLSKIFGNKEMRILMLGLDAAGKTSILCHIHNLSLCLCLCVELSLLVREFKNCQISRTVQSKSGRGPSQILTRIIDMSINKPF